MIERIKQTWFGQATSRVANWAQESLAPALLRRRTFGAAFFASLLATLYWGAISSDRYISEAHVVIQRTDMGVRTGWDIAGLLSNQGNTDHGDQLLLRDHLLSVDMLEKLDAKLQLRSHYSDGHRDPLSRMWFENASTEWFHRHYLSRVNVEFDEYAGVLVIKAQAYEPKTAHAITTLLVDEGEKFMNEMAHRLARDQVVFLEKQVAEMSGRLLSTRNAVLEYQNTKGLVSPRTTVEALATIATKMEGQLAEMKAKRSALLAYLSPDAPDVVQINAQIAAIENQLLLEQGRLASPKGQTLNRVAEEYQRLELEAKFAQDIYQTALVALEKGRIEATRTLKKLSILQSPTLPQYPLEPRRIYNIVVFILCVAILAGIVHLVAAIIRDHKD